MIFGVSWVSKLIYKSNIKPKKSSIISIYVGSSTKVLLLILTINGYTATSSGNSPTTNILFCISSRKPSSWYSEAAVSTTFSTPRITSSSLRCLKIVPVAIIHSWLTIPRWLGSGSYTLVTPFVARNSRKSILVYPPIRSNL